MIDSLVGLTTQQKCLFFFVWEINCFDTIKRVISCAK